MSAELVLCSIDGAIATLTLNRPEKLNALTADTFERLRTHLEALAGDDAVRVVVLTGAGRSFCAGHDLAALAEGDALAHRFREAETIGLLEDLPKPTIAKIHGHCFTGGLELALGCDMLVAGESAQLGDTHSQWGLVPLWGMSVRLPERVGMSRAKELSFTARRMPAAEAAGIGLVDHCVPDAELDRYVADLADRIAANSPGSHRIYKALYANARSMDRTAAMRAETEMTFGFPDDAAARLAGGTRG
ncbi:Enoyl-CoA hydratase/carnithine racemase [Nocardia amikacinitolerans]|uniref:enoyl-CoA hydratase/isomerase family protein n=1 Tax=Nocardia amikacinitolerans TaxID=756689 RepID=UPI0020A48BE8|nr:enoyl-CoA hydratase/isomerase family protein [Nocardia amikacinitolerans]MCP2296766.1 Enoyl-CoA hydratase/carnithine racemase [Nocardia amikacinitolerans]